MSKLPEHVTVLGAVDPHTHLREPSPVNKAENFESGSLAALHGGYVFLNDMPNTQDWETNTKERVVEKHRLICRKAYVPVGVVGGVDPESGDISQIEAMDPIVTAWKFMDDISTGNDRVRGPSAFEPFVQEILRVNPEALIIVHAGKDNVQEWIDVVAGKYGLRLHIAHVNNPEDVKLVMKAKAQGLLVTCEVTPYHLFMTEEHVKKLGWFGRAKPPLVALGDTEQLKYQLVHRAIDMIGTDHAPHSAYEKMLAQVDNPEGLDDLELKRVYGIPNLEFSNHLLLNECEVVNKLGKLTLKRFTEVTAIAPRRLLGLGISPSTNVTYEIREREITDDDVVSKAGWTPFVGEKIHTRVVEVNIRGKATMREGQVTENAKAGIPMWRRGLTL